MDLRTSPNYRLLQVFLSMAGVFEVYVNMKKKTYRCTCPGFRARRWCKHCDVVGEKALSENGYALPVKQGAPPLDDDTMLDAVKFRDWVIHYGKVEVLDGGR
jgi:hypothetical protein